ncbi:MAG: restriction endonuclease subunit S [Methylobacter sp.]
MTDVITQHLDVWTSAIASKATAGRGSNDKQTAYGIKKLRELILATALRGLFETQNEYLDDAIDEQITNSKKAYYQSISKKPKEYVFGPALLHEFPLPNGWQWKRVGELCDLQTGATPSTQRSEYFSGNIPWLVSGDINQGVINDCEGRISEEAMNNSNCKLLPEKTILIALNGQGKTRASVALLNIPAACNQSLVGMIPFDHSILDPTFLLLALKYRYYEIRDITGQNQRRGLNMGLVAELSIPLPPIATQHRIVAKADELMALCDQLEQQQSDSIAAHQTLVQILLDTLTKAANTAEFKQAWSRIADHFDTLFTTEPSIGQLKQTLLQLAVMGKLVPQNHNGESARLFLENIFKEKKQLVDQGIIRTQKAFPQIEAAEKLQNIPASWELSRLGEFTIVGTGSTPSRDKASYYFPPEVNWVTSGETSQNFIFETNEKISKIALKETNVSVYPIGTLIIAMYGQGKTRGQVSELMIEAGTNQACAAVVCVNKELAHRRFIKLFFMKAYEELRSHSAGGAQPNLNLAKISNTVIPIPPLEEQNRIVAKVDELMALCDALKARIAAAQTTQLQLADAIVEQAVA